MSTIQRHPYHLVDPSPWPLVTSFCVLLTATGAALFMHSFKNGDILLFTGLFLTVTCMGI
jgi:hypothetical protein